jgi:hypothetical protein
MKRFLFLPISLILLFSFTSCGVSPGDYDSLKAELEQAKADIAALQAQVAEAEQTISAQQETINTFADNIERLFDQRNQAWDENDQLQRDLDFANAIQVPWPEFNIYVDPARSITVKAGEEFVIKYDLDNEMFIVSTNEFHDEAYISNEGRWVIERNIFSSLPGVGWFLFKARRPGNTQITINHVGHLIYAIEDPVTFEVVIT